MNRELREQAIAEHHQGLELALRGLMAPADSLTERAIAWAIAEIDELRARLTTNQEVENEHQHQPG